MRTDGWVGYNGLEAGGYSHEVIRQETTLGDNLLPWAQGVGSSNLPAPTNRIKQLRAFQGLCEKPL